jgi:putative transposase
VLEAEKRVRILGIGEIRVHQRSGRNRPIRGIPKAATLRREGNRWWLDVRCAQVPDQPLPPTACEVGVDVGVASLVATSDGWLYTNPRYLKQAQDRLARAQQELATKKPGSRARRRVAARVRRLHRKVANQRRDLAHKISKDLVEAYDLIAVEDLKVHQMARRAKPKKATDGTYLPNGAAAKRGLNRSIHDSGWAQLTAMLTYKAESAGRCMLAVSPAHTSQRCVRCGHTARGNRCSQAMFRCRACGHTDHADVNAARNILGAGQALRASAREGSN